MSEFTKGPWIQSHRKLGNGNYSTQVYTEDGETICTLHWYPKPKGIDEYGRHIIGTYREANARLIAAAPDMYEALRELVNSECSFFNSAIESDHLFDFIEWRDRAILALRKATGESTDASGA
jgi:hypothetical protein